jgi:stage II sporulation protein E
MGTGDGAARAGNGAADYLRRMLSVGFPASHALESLNSLLVLQGGAGAVTVDLAEVDLSSGTAVLYKWGAAPSWLLKSGRAEKIGTATPPPGLSVTDARETVMRLSLRRGETLILLSDGLEAGETLSRMELTQPVQPGELAQLLLESGCRSGDDATAAVVCLEPLG